MKKQIKNPKKVKEQVKKIESKRKVRETTERFIDPVIPPLIAMSGIEFKEEVKKIRKSLPIIKNSLLQENADLKKEIETFTQEDKVEDCKTVVGLAVIGLLGVWFWWAIIK